MTATVVKMTIREWSLILRRKNERSNQFPVYSHVRQGFQIDLSWSTICSFHE